MAMHMDDADEFGSEAPRPIDATVAEGTFDHLEQGQGAVSAGRRTAGTGNRPSASDKGTMSKRTLGIIAACAVLIIVVAVVVFVRVLDAPAPTTSEPAEAEQTAVAADESIPSHGATYELEEADGVYQLVEVRDTSRVSLGELPGTPAGLVLYDGAIIVPEDVEDGSWDVMAYTIGSGWSQLMDKDGNATGGEGSVSDVQLDGSTLVLKVNDERVEVPLVW